MTYLGNLFASTNADFIGNDANPTLTIANTSTGIGLTVNGGTTGPAVKISGASSLTANAALQATFAAPVAGATIAPLQLVASTASQAVISIAGVFLSTASINLAANKTAFIIPVYHASQAVFGYLAASIGVS